MTMMVEQLTAALAGRYQVLRELGAGGMATVYLAEDARHHRQVALKVLRPELAAVIGAERFLKEIETTANLQHPHILPLFDSGTVDGTVFYVMPYVEGESLRDRLARDKQLPIADAVRIAREVASALDYAHRKGIIHRDIKPENILLHDGQALVADFGIALAASTTGGTRMTETGMSLGTPHYMSPEQAMGERTLDARTDVYALGCVLYEMLTGEPPFNGPTAQAIVARVMTDRPRSVTETRPTVPEHVEAAVTTALQKLPADRFATAAEFSTALASTGYTTPGRPVPAAVATRGARLPWLVAGVALAASAILGTRQLLQPGPEEQPVIRAILQLPADAEIGRPLVTVAPDGSRVVVAVTQGGISRLLHRRLSDLEFTPIAGTDDGEFHYLSHDGGTVVFRKGGNSVRVPLDGGPPVTMGAATWPGHWAADGMIYYPASYNTGLSRVPAEGGERTELSRPDTTRRELGHWWPQLLPGGEVLFTAFAAPLAKARIEALAVGTGRRTVLVEGAVFGRYLPTGHLLFARGGVVFAQRMDLDPARVSGPAVPVLDDVATQTTEGISAYAVSDNGTLAYIRASRYAADSRIVWLDRTGRQVDTVAAEGRLSGPALSPDGRRLAYAREQDFSEIWVADLVRGTRTRISDPTMNNFGARWTPSGDALMYVSERPIFDLYRQVPDGAAAAEPLLVSGEDKTTFTMTVDGRELVFETSALPNRELGRLELGSGKAPTRLLSTTGNLKYPALSPDGRWLAYASDESGAYEVYLAPYPGITARRLQVSGSGGREPHWTRGGRELVYRSGDAFVATAFDPATGTLGATTRLFEGRFIGTFQETGTYDVTPDGQRFLVVVRPPGTEAREIVVVTNWFKELREKMAAAGR